MALTPGMYTFSRYRRGLLASLGLAYLTPELCHAANLTHNSSALRILVVGDSLSAEYGLRRHSGWVWLLQQRLIQLHPNIEIINASVSGDTTSAGRARLQPLLARQHVDIVIIELGANDALRGLPLSMSQDNLTAMIKQSESAGAKVLVTGMQIPPNYGREYADAFKKMYEEVTRANHATLVPFLLQGIADKRELFQADGIHPNESAQATIMENVFGPLMSLIKT